MVSVRVVPADSIGCCGAVRSPRQAKLSAAVAAVRASSARTSRAVQRGCGAGADSSAPGSRSERPRAAPRPGSGETAPWRQIVYTVKASSTKAAVSAKPTTRVKAMLVALDSHSSSVPTWV